MRKSGAPHFRSSSLSVAEAFFLAAPAEAETASAAMHQVLGKWKPCTSGAGCLSATLYAKAGRHMWSLIPGLIPGALVASATALGTICSRCTIAAGMAVAATAV